MVPLKGFKVVDYISSSLPKLAWRNGRNRRCLADVVAFSGLADRDLFDVHRRALSVVNEGQLAGRFEPLQKAV
jgi:hypothetical protein